jgi:hypothetical protein
LARVDTAHLADLARADGRLGLDTEFMPEGRYKPLLCLVQIAAGGEIAVLDPLGEGFDAAPLAAVLADPAVEVIVHAGRQDVAILRREWQTEFVNVFDTQIAAGFAGFSAQAGYNGLLHDVLKVRLPKTASFTRWDARPLTEEQLRYARGDVEHLLALADEIGERLRSRGRLEWAREECRAIAEATDERDPEEVWRRLPRVNGLDPRDRAVALVRLVGGERVRAHHGALDGRAEVQGGQRGDGALLAAQRAGGGAGRAAHLLLAGRLAEADRQHERSGELAERRHLHELVGLAGGAQGAEHLEQRAVERGVDSVGTGRELQTVRTLQGAHDDCVRGGGAQVTFGEGQLRGCHVLLQGCAW